MNDAASNYEETAARAPRFSILLPTHNRADVLPFALRSVFAQTTPDFELLIVGDGCTDNTAEVVAGFADPRVRWFDLPKGAGFGYANRNVALREARGRYVAFMAHDDLWLPDHLELLADSLEAQEGAELTYSRPLWVVPRGLVAPAAFNLEHPETLELFLQKKGISIAASCFVYRRECLERYGYWDEQIPASGDWEMWVRFIERGGRRNFAYLPQPTCLHFRANWRTAANAGPPHLLRVWAALHEYDHYLPAALKIHVPENMSEQEATWNAMAADPLGWTRTLRAAVVEALDTRVAQSDQLLLTLLRAQEVNRQNGAPATNFIDSTRQLEILAHVAGELEYQQASLVWKIVRRLRRLQTHVLPPDTRRQKIWQSVSRRARKFV
jgi:glycosyltransferase involved in cell wall biosynthesis